jgi:hypothetical protein
LLWNDLGGALGPVRVGRIAWSAVDVVRAARDGCVVVAYRADDDAIETLVFWPGDASGISAASMVQELREYVVAARSGPSRHSSDD